MNKLTTYEAAWLIGGAERAALAVFVALATDGRLEVADKRQRVKPVRSEATYPVEAAVRAKGQLRDMFEHPLPGMPKIDPFKPVRDNTIDGTLGPSTGSGYL
jgi:hypothetical protein